MSDNIMEIGRKLSECGCSCRKRHISSVKCVITESGAINKLPEIIKGYNAEKVFIIADKNTYKAAGEQVCNILQKSNICFSKYIYKTDTLAPDEKAIGDIIMHYDSDCGIIIGVGSGVINDIGKIVSKVAEKPYIIVATAPSMDGYASATSSMEVGGLKVSLSSRCADVIIGDINILKNAPERMLKSGLGDMLAKYISICEWRISNIINGEYYCEEVAELIRKALRCCAENTQGLLLKNETAVKTVFEGLVLGGMAMEFAGLSRPASGVEHYFSHIWDMRGLEFDTDTDLHGIQCAIATLYASRLYEQVKQIIPDKAKAIAYAEKFDFAEWSKKLRGFLGKAAESMIEAEKNDKKYDPQKHRERLEVICGNWDEIVKIINEEIPSSEYIENIMNEISMPKTASEINIDSDIVPMTFKATKDVRDKYVLSRLVWDLGIIDELDYSCIK